MVCEKVTELQHKNKKNWPQAVQVSRGSEWEQEKSWSSLLDIYVQHKIPIRFLRENVK